MAEREIEKLRQKTSSPTYEEISNMISSLSRAVSEPEPEPNESPTTGIFTESADNIDPTPTYTQVTSSSETPSSSGANGTERRENAARLSSFFSENRDREEHSSNRRRAGYGLRANRENITTVGLRNAIGLRRRNLFSANLQDLRSGNHNERRLLR